MKTVSFTKEWQKSSVNSKIAVLNVKELSGKSALDTLFISASLERKNDGRVVDRLLRSYRHIERDGGWWVSGLDPLNNWQSMEWGQFKPVVPRTFYDRQKGGQEKTIKYEAPPKTETRAFFLRVPKRTWQEVALRHGMQLPEIQECDRGEALGFWQWVLGNNLPIVITEGAKKAGAGLTAGYPTVALPGVSSGYRSKGEVTRKLIPDMQAIATPGRRIYLAFDNDGKASTKKAVRTAISATAGLFAKAGCDVRVVEWDKYPEKGLDDLITARGAEVFHEQFERALRLDRWRCQGFSKLSATPDYSINSRYLGKLPIPESAKIIAIKSPKGTGKTETLAAIVGEGQAEGIWTIALTHRVQLGEALAERLGIPYVRDLRAKTNELGQSLGYALCVDSLHPKSQARFDAEHWEDGLVIIDEVEQVLLHLLESRTCASDRVAILGQLKLLLQNAIASPKGRIIISDADLSDVSIEFVKQLSGYKGEAWIATNDYKPEEGWQIRHYESPSPAGLVDALEKHLQDGGRPLICCSAQKKKSPWGTQNLELRLASNFPNLKILRLDSETIADPNHPAYGCIAHLDKVLANYDIAIASPTLETGVSIDLKNHFTSVWGIFQGVAPEHSARQALARLREPVERHVWAARRGIGQIGSGGISPRSLLAGQHKLTAHNLRTLTSFGWDDDLDGEELDKTALQTWAKLACKVNGGMIGYKDAILDGLKEEGHSIITVISNANIENELAKDMRQMAKDAQGIEAERIVEATEITNTEYEALEAKKSRTEEERRQIKKHFLKLRYEVEVTPELVVKDEDGWYPKISMHYYLTIGNEHLPARDKRRASAQKQAGEGKVWKPDFNRSLLSIGVKMLKDPDKLGILGLLEEGREIRACDPDVARIANLAIACAWEVKQALNITITDRMSPIEICRRLLDKLGIKITCIKREGKRGDRQRVYQVADYEDGRQMVFMRWFERDEAGLDESVSTETI